MIEDETKPYIDILARDPANFDALTGLGTLLSTRGYPRAARTAFAEAVSRHPGVAAGHANLANALLDNDQVVAARTHYETALRLAPDNIQAHQGLAVLLLRLGEEEAAQRHARIGFEKLTAWPYRGDRPAVPMLLVLSALGGNLNTARFWDDRIFQKWTLVAEFCTPDLQLPTDGVVFNGIGDADRCARGLSAAEIALSRSMVPVINRPAAVLATKRVTNAHRLGKLDGVLTARTESMPRTLLCGPDGPAALAENGFTFPLLLRSPGFQTGQHFVMVEHAGDLADAAARLPGTELLVMEFVDVRSADGKVRKYRVMIVDGRLYPLHLAISREWMVHYFTAEMHDPEHRAEEAIFLENMTGVLGPQSVASLESIKDTLGLDYGGIDFGLDAAGRVVVFEANATMVVLHPPAGVEWAPKRAAVERIEDAVRTMLLERASASQAIGARGA
ncbi:MAG TPA: tetratricopeptide repeat protein [Candidatus Binatia bacterium]|nr:tetratricopeptide repeat protein [Candidatus Binatia bacterium]